MADEFIEVGEGTVVKRIPIGEASKDKEAKPDVPVPKSETKEYTEIEQQAMDQGWDPEWDGDPTQKRSAREFLDRGELLGKIKSQSQELREIRDTLKGLSEHNKKVFQAGYERALTDLRAQKAKAISDNDGATVVRLDEQIDQTRDALNAIKNTPVQAPQQRAADGISPEFNAFLKQNPWYNTSSTMKRWAHGTAIDFAKEHDNATEEQVYNHIAQEVRKEFPEKFKKTAPPSPDGEGRQTSGRSVSGKSDGDGAFDKLMAELPDDEARVAKDFVKRGIMTKAKYIEDYNMVRR